MAASCRHRRPRAPSTTDVFCQPPTGKTSTEAPPKAPDRPVTRCATPRPNRHSSPPPLSRAQYHAFGFTPLSPPRSPVCRTPISKECPYAVLDALAWAIFSRTMNCLRIPRGCSVLHVPSITPGAHLSPLVCWQYLFDDNGGCYQGQVYRGQRHGLGVHRDANDDTYYGTWCRGKFVKGDVEVDLDDCNYIRFFRGDGNPRWQGRKGVNGF
eukprot:839739-Prymnesium_polylepis.1